MLLTLFASCVLVLVTIAQGSPAELNGNIMKETRRQTSTHTSRKNMKCTYGTQKCGYYHSRSWLTCAMDSTYEGCCAEPCIYDTTEKGRYACWLTPPSGHFGEPKWDYCDSPMIPYYRQDSYGIVQEYKPVLPGNRQSSHHLAANLVPCDSNGCDYRCDDKDPERCNYLTCRTLDGDVRKCCAAECKNYETETVSYWYCDMSALYGIRELDFCTEGAPYYRRLGDDPLHEHLSPMQ